MKLRKTLFLRRDLLEARQILRFSFPPAADRAVAVEADARRDGFVDQRVERRHADLIEHGFQIVRTGTDVSAGKVIQWV